jgi:hypothetical protein
MSMAEASGGDDVIAYWCPEVSPPPREAQPDTILSGTCEFCVLHLCLAGVGIISQPTLVLASLQRRSPKILVTNIFWSTSKTSWLLAASTSALFFKLSSTRVLLRQRPRGGLKLCWRRVFKGCRRKTVLNFSKIYGLGLFRNLFAWRSNTTTDRYFYFFVYWLPFACAECEVSNLFCYLVYVGMTAYFTFISTNQNWIGFPFDLEKPVIKVERLKHASTNVWLVIIKWCYLASECRWSTDCTTGSTYDHWFLCLFILRMISMPFVCTLGWGLRICPENPI